VLIGEITLNQEPRIALYAETEIPISRAGLAALKDQLMHLLDMRFRPTDPEPLTDSKLAVAEVADLLCCRCLTVLQMVTQGKLHPVSDQHGELYFDPAEVANARLPLKSRSL
jgi:hypothetical protein